MKQTLENIAAIRCDELATAATSAAVALLDLRTQESRQHAAEAKGAAKIARQWAKVLRAKHAAQDPKP